MAISAFDKIQRGVDSSGRRLFGTRQMFQHFDRVNDRVGGRLVVVQGSFNRGTTASAGTHDLAGCFDIRTWNLSTAERNLAMRAGRDPFIVGGAAWWYRHSGQGFDPHIHMLLLGDAPMTSQTAFQVSEYQAGRNGLANRGADDFWRPDVIVNYKYIKDDEMNADQERRLHEKLDDFRDRFEAFAEHEVARDVAERKRFRAAIDMLGGRADRLGEQIREAEKVDNRLARALRKDQAEILTFLKDNPDVTGKDNPSDDAMGEL
jgi:hypothetical protein